MTRPIYTALAVGFQDLDTTVTELLDELGETGTDPLDQPAPFTEGIS